jgi:hypothetical protein
MFGIRESGGRNWKKHVFHEPNPPKMSFSPTGLFRLFPNSFLWSNIRLNKSKPMKHLLYLGFRPVGSWRMWWTRSILLFFHNPNGIRGGWREPLAEVLWLWVSKSGFSKLKVTLQHPGRRKNCFAWPNLAAVTSLLHMLYTLWATSPTRPVGWDEGVRPHTGYIIYHFGNEKKSILIWILWA